MCIWKISDPTAKIAKAVKGLFMQKKLFQSLRKIQVDNTPNECYLLGV